MPVIHKRQNFSRRRVREREFRAAHRITFDADTENLAFHARFNEISVIIGKYFVDRLFVAFSRTNSVRRNVFKTVARPDIHYAGNTRFSRKVLGNLNAGFAVRNPEIPDFFIGRRKRKPRSRHRMREERRVKIKSHTVFFRKIHPLFEMFGLKFIPVCKFTLFKDGVTGVNVDFLFARNEFQDFFYVLHEFFGRSRLAGIVARSLYSARKRPVVVETGYVVSLPAMQRHGYGCQNVKRLVGIYAVLFKCLFRTFVIIH